MEAIVNIKIIKEILLFIRSLYRSNIVKTIYINYKTQPLKKAFKLPIFIGKNSKIHSLRGNIIIDSEIIRPGMIKIGYKHWDLFPSSYVTTQLTVKGCLVIKGPLIVSGGVHLFVWKNAFLEIGQNCSVGGGTMLKSISEITIGENTCITGDCTILDSNMHYVKNIETGIIAKKQGKIHIGKNCWINQSSIITKGTFLPDFSIVARGSFLNKDYTSYGTNLFLVGSPAVVSKNKVQRIFNIEKEKALNEYFRRNEGEMEYRDELGIFKDEFSLPKI